MSLRKLAKETAIYGISSILGRTLYFLLTPLYTRIFSTAEYGIVTDLFAITAFLMVVFTYRMETAYFRFGTESGESERASFNTALWSIIGSTIFLGTFFLLFTEQIAAWSKYPEHSIYVVLVILILCLDTLTEIPYAYLRLSGRPIRFAFIRLTNICVNIGLNLFFLVLCPYLLSLESWAGQHDLIRRIYDPSFGVGYIFLSNVIASLTALLLLFPYFFRLRFSFDFSLWRKMLGYAAPLIVVGFSYVINETLDRKIMIYLLPGTEEENFSQLGIYGANYKLAMLISLFTQAFRYGAEPFFFRQRSAVNAKQLYADLARFFTIFGALGFLGITLFIDYFKYFIGSAENPAYWSGLGVAPILLMANIFLGLYYNFSVWYKLTDRTGTGAYISMAGAAMTIILNLLLVPVYGFYGAAWATLIVYFGMTMASYLLGRRHYPVNYDLRKFALYLGVATLLYLLSDWLRDLMPAALLLRTALNFLLLLVYLGMIFVLEKATIQRYFLRKS